MFDTLTAQPSAIRRTDPRMLPIALTLHVLVGLSVVVVQTWKVETVEEPTIMEAFQTVRFAPEPPPIEIRRPQPAPRPAGAPQPQTTPAAVTPTVVQPEEIHALAEVPATATSPIPDIVSTDTGGGGPISGPETGGGGEPGNGTCVGNCAAGGIDSDEPIVTCEDMRQARVTARVNPAYPELARRVRKQGTVLIQAVIDRSGAVRDARVVSPKLGFGLEESALAAAYDYHFAPATCSGAAVTAYFTLTVTFSLQ